MEEMKVQIGNDVLLDIGIHSEWYISAIGYDGENVDVRLRRKPNSVRYSKWWLSDISDISKEKEENDVDSY